jgi:hypothetical protein
MGLEVGMSMSQVPGGYRILIGFRVVIGYPSGLSFHMSKYIKTTILISTSQYTHVDN